MGKKKYVFEVLNEIITDAKDEKEFRQIFNDILLKIIMQIEFENSC